MEEDDVVTAGGATGLGMALIGDAVNSGGSRVTATRTLNLHGVNSISVRPSGTVAGNGVGGVGRLIRTARIGTWVHQVGRKNTGGRGT